MNFPPVADRDHHHDQPAVLDQAYNPMVANAIRPQLALVAVQDLAELPGIAACDNALLETLKQPSLDRAVQLA